MKKLEFFNNEMTDGVLSNKDFKVMLAVFNKPYMTLKQVSEKTQLNELDTFVSLKNLKDSNPSLVELNHGKFITTLECDDIVLSVASEYFKHQNPDFKGTQRPITKNMEDFKQYVLEQFEDGYFSKIKIFRQNYQLIIADKKKGFKNIEIRNNGDVRVAVSKVKRDVCDLMMNIDGVTYVPPSETSYISNYDYKCTYEKLAEIIKTIKSI